MLLKVLSRSQSGFALIYLVRKPIISILRTRGTLDDFDSFTNSITINRVRASALGDLSLRFRLKYRW